MTLLLTQNKSQSLTWPARPSCKASKALSTVLKMACKPVQAHFLPSSASCNVCQFLRSCNPVLTSRPLCLEQPPLPPLAGMICSLISIRFLEASEPSHTALHVLWPSYPALLLSIALVTPPPTARGSSTRAGELSSHCCLSSTHRNIWGM